MKRPLRALLAVFVLSLFLGCNNYNILDKLENPGGVGKTVPLAAPCSTCFIFLTNSQSNGNLGGIAGADAKCRADSARPNGGVYKALLSDNNTRMACSGSDCTLDNAGQKDWVIKPMTQYINTNGQNVFLSNGFGTHDFTASFANSVSALGSYTWTGLTTAWGYSAIDCAAWTEGTSSGMGSYGNENATDGTFLYTGDDYCAGNRRLYCVEQ